MPSCDYCLVGLGNPGSQYHHTRHNAGFRLIDYLRRGESAQALSSTRALSSLAEIWKIKMEGRSVVLAKPLTFMNNSGEATLALAGEFALQIREQLFVAFDDLDLPLGEVRLRPHGSAGTHRGMASVIGSLGHGDFPRIRLGVGPKPANVRAEDFVLADFKKEEEPLAQDMIQKAAGLWQSIVRHGLALAISKYHTHA